MGKRGLPKCKGIEYCLSWKRIYKNPTQNQKQKNKPKPQQTQTKTKTNQNHQHMGKNFSQF